MLTLSQVRKSFVGNSKPILKNINLSLDKGEFCVVIGSNGSGKSTLMKTISGEYAVDSGTIFIDHQNVTQRDRNGIIASVIQDVNHGIVPELTLFENMILSLDRGKSATLRFYGNKRSVVLDLLTQLELDLERYLNVPLKFLSGGQKQMVAMLMAVSANPSILLLDEHTSALDPNMQRKLMEFTVNHVTKNHLTTLMITHKLDDAIHYGDRLIMLHQGNIVLDLKKPEKALLDAEQLLTLYHHYEHESLLGKDIPLLRAKDVGMR